LDEQIFAEQNKVRANPKIYVDKLKAMLPSFKEKVYKAPGYVPVTTTEGKSAVEAAIKYLESATVAGLPLRRRLEKKEDKNESWKTAPLIGTDKFTIEDDLASTCKDHVVDTGPTGVEGHKGTDDSTPETRIKNYGIQTELIFESLVYG